MPRVVGVGNPDRADDGAGRAVARRLRQRSGGRIAAVECGGETAALLDAWQGAEAVIVVDVVRSGSPPGTILRVDLGAGPLPAARFAGGTHGLGLAEAVELARALGTLPASLVLYGIEGACFTPGAGLSPEVEGAVERAVDRVMAELLAPP